MRCVDLWSVSATAGSRPIGIPTGWLPVCNSALARYSDVAG